MDRRRALGVAAAAIGLALVGCDAETGVHTSGGKPSSGGGTAGSTSPPPTTGGRALLPAEVTHGRLDRTNVALTYHGQGDPKLADRLLTELEKGGARATVLAVGSWLQAEPAMARRKPSALRPRSSATRRSCPTTSIHSITPIPVRFLSCATY